MKFTQIPSDTFQKLQLNAGLLLDEFTPATGEIGNILGATTGGISFSMNPEYADWGEDVDNCPNNMMELKRITAYDPAISGTFLTVSADMAQLLIGAADVDDIKIVPRQQLEDGDFSDIWWVGDYSDVNVDETKGSGQTTDGSAGFIAIHLMNALNTGGFQIQSTKDEKGQFSFDFHGHYSIDAQDTVPFEIYVQVGEKAS